jgi:hypothetical protein
MRSLFLLDNSEYVEVAPEKLQIRQLSPNAAALGTEVMIPVNGADGKPEKNEDGTTKTQLGFRPFINYAVNLLPVFETPEAELEYLNKLVADKTAALKAELEAAKAEAKPAAKKSNGKAVVAKRKAN